MVTVMILVVGSVGLKEVREVQNHPIKENLPTLHSWYPHDSTLLVPRVCTNLDIAISASP